MPDLRRLPVLPHHASFLRHTSRAFGAWLLLVIACTFLLSACGGGSRAPDQPQSLPADHDLLFTNEAPDGARHIQRWRLDGSPPQAVPGGERGVRPLPRADGRTLVFTSQPVAAFDPPQLQLLELAAPPARLLSLDPTVVEREIVFAPDGRRVAYVSQRDDPGGADVFVAELAVGPAGAELRSVQNLTPGATSGDSLDVTPSWSPDGTRIAFTSYRGNGAPALWTMRADGSDVRQITTVPDSGEVGDHFPVWSPDGTLLAFQRRNRDQVRIGLVPATGGAPALFEFAGKAFHPAWSPDGRVLAFAGEVDGELDLYVRLASGADEPLRLPNPGPDRDPIWIRR